MPYITNWNDNQTVSFCFVRAWVQPVISPLNKWRKSCPRTRNVDLIGIKSPKLNPHEEIMWIMPTHVQFPKKPAVPGTTVELLSENRTKILPSVRPRRIYNLSPEYQYGGINKWLLVKSCPYNCEGCRRWGIFQKNWLSNNLPGFS